MTPEEREVNTCVHWLWHRMAAKKLLSYPESCIIEDEWIGRPPPGALAAIERGDDDLTPWCPELTDYWASFADTATT